MKRAKLITLIILAVFLMARVAFANEPFTGKGRFGDEYLDRIQEQLDLTEEQAISVQEIFTGGKHDMAELFEKHGLERSEVRILRQELAKFRQEPFENLKTELSQEQLLTLRNEIMKDGALNFILLPEEEKLIRIQHSLEISEDQANRVVPLLEEGRSERENVLENLGLNIEQMIVIQQDMATHREEMKNSLSTVLNVQQMDQFEELLRYRMEHGKRGHGRLFIRKGE